MMKAAEIARKNQIPYFGICYGFQWAVVEYARNVAGLTNADSTAGPRVFSPGATVVSTACAFQPGGGGCGYGSYRIAFGSRASPAAEKMMPAITSRCWSSDSAAVDFATCAAPVFLATSRTVRVAPFAVRLVWTTATTTRPGKARASSWMANGFREREMAPAPRPCTLITASNRRPCGGTSRRSVGSAIARFRLSGAPRCAADAAVGASPTVRKTTRGATLQRRDSTPRDDVLRRARLGQRGLRSGEPR